MTEITVKDITLRLQPVEHVPEISLYLSDSPHYRVGSNRFECWQQAWVGGQALARYILDNPSLVAGKTVVDIASGCGIVAIAAKLAGAARVIAIDDYEPAIQCIGLNATVNNVDIETIQEDIFNYSSDVGDLFLLGDPFYNDELFGYIKGNFSPVLVGSPIRLPYYVSYFSSAIQTYTLSVPPQFDETNSFDAHIWWLSE
jgi:predicted nicotinamide N-methyase